MLVVVFWSHGAYSYRGLATSNCIIVATYKEMNGTDLTTILPHIPLPCSSLVSWRLAFYCFDVVVSFSAMGKQCRFKDEEDCYLTFAYRTGTGGELEISTQKNKGE